MANFLTAFIILLSSSSALAAPGSEYVYVGNGGHIIACFKKPVQKNFFYSNDQIAEEGYKNLKVIEALDYYVAKRQVPSIPSYLLDDSDIEDLVRIPPNGLEQEIYARFSKADPKVYKMFKCLADQLGHYTLGIRAEKGLVEVSDQRLPIAVPRTCAIKQAIIRQDTVFYFNPGLNLDLTVMTNSKVDQQAVLQLHEEFYAFSVEVYGQKDSARARNLLALLLSSNPTREQIQKHIAYFGPVLKDPCVQH